MEPSPLVSLSHEKKKRKEKKRRAADVVLNISRRPDGLSFRFYNGRSSLQRLLYTK
jgi:hypothetical protein